MENEDWNWYILGYVVLTILVVIYIHYSSKSETSYNSVIYLSEKYPSVTQSVSNGKNTMYFTHDITPRVQFKIYPDSKKYECYRINISQKIQIALFYKNELLQITKDKGILEIEEKIDLTLLELRVLTFNNNVLTNTFE